MAVGSQPVVALNYKAMGLSQPVPQGLPYHQVSGTTYLGLTNVPGTYCTGRGFLDTRVMVLDPSELAGTLTLAESRSSLRHAL